LQAYAASNPQFSFAGPQSAAAINTPALQFQEQIGDEGVTNQAAASGVGASGNTQEALSNYNQGLASTYYNQAFNQAQSQFQTNQNATLSNLQALIGSGSTANGQEIAAGSTFGVPQANNTINAANTNAGLQQYIGSLNLQGQTTAGNQGIQTATTQGGYAIGSASAQAAGLLGTLSSAGGLADGLLGGVASAATGAGSDSLIQLLGLG
jgi:hypothetical protein